MTPRRCRLLWVGPSVALLGASLFATAAHGEYRVEEARTRIELRHALLSDLGLEVRLTGEVRQKAGASKIELAASGSQSLSFEAPAGDFETFAAGALQHRGGLVIERKGREPIVLAPLTVRPGSGFTGFEIADRGGEVVLFADHMHAQFEPGAGTLEVRNLDLRLAEKLAARLGLEEFAGIAIGTLEMDLTVTAQGGEAESFAPRGDCVEPNWFEPGVETDIALTSINTVQQTVREPGVRVAITPSVSLANVGTADVPWYSFFTAPSPPYNNDQHPFLVWAFYRLEGGVFEQIGRSDVKHAFFATNDGCPCPGGNVLWAFLGVCGDVYGVSTNESRTWLAPRDEITAHTGVWERCGSHFDADCDDQRDSSHSHDDFEHRMAVAESDLDRPGARYFIEAWYLVRDDVNLANSMGWLEVDPSLVGAAWSFPSVGSTVSGPATGAWVDPSALGPGEASTVLDTGQGSVGVSLAASSDGGINRTVVVLTNHTFDRQVESFSLDLGGAQLESAVSPDGTATGADDWRATVVGGFVTWSTPTFEAALDWGESRTFVFETDQPFTASSARVKALDPGGARRYTIELATRAATP